MANSPRLWSWRLSPFAGKVRAAFAEKGVPVELLEIHPVKRPARLRELNPLNRVPVLEVGDVALRESSIICEWLEEAHPEPPLWPREAAARAWARGWARYVDDALTASFFLSMRKQAFGLLPTDPPDEVERLRGKLAKSWPTLEATLGVHEGPWICGEQFTHADLAGLALSVRLPEWAPDLVPGEQALPRVTAWMAALRARPSASEIDREGERVESAA